MLSVLIPIYNYDCKDLVDSIHQQGIITDKPFEIIALDDGSSEQYHKANKYIDQLRYAKYVRSEVNIGRSKSRNKLASMARFDHLIFLDCDSKLLTNTFVRTYLDHIGNAQVVQGGRVYPKPKPNLPDKWMHWTYGSIRESKTAVQRSRFPYRWFHSNNFMIQKSLIDSIRFDEKLLNYGYEDSLLASRLQEQKIDILHIDNEVIHLDILSNSDFLDKSKKAVENLHRLIQARDIKNVRLVRLYKWVKILRLKRWVSSYYNKKKGTWVKRLIEGEASLRDFDLYRLGYMLSLDEN